MNSLSTTNQISKTTNTSIEDSEGKTIFGFWVYIMTDCILFASLFATYAVLRNNTFGGLSGRDLFNLPFALAETLILLTSSFTCGLAMLAVHRKDKNKVIALFTATFLLGISFLILEISEFSHLVRDGHGWQSNAFMSSYFTLVGTHGLHISIGLLWIFILIVQTSKKGLNRGNIKRLTMLSLFWHFLDIIWIFIFSVVYLIGKS